MLNLTSFSGECTNVWAWDASDVGLDILLDFWFAGPTIDDGSCPLSIASGFQLFHYPNKISMQWFIHLYISIDSLIFSSMYRTSFQMLSILAMISPFGCV